MPVNRDYRTYGVTVDKHKGRVPTPRQEEQQRLIAATYAHINRRVGEYIRIHHEDEHWATRVRAYYEHLVSGTQMPGTIKLDQSTRQLVRGWVDEARQETGLLPPNRATKRRKKNR